MKIRVLSRSVILLLLAVMLLSDASALIPAAEVTPVEAGFPGPNVIISFFRAFGALNRRNRIYGEARATSAEMNEYYDTLIAQAGETRRQMISDAAAGQKVSPLMARAYVRAEAALEAERAAAIAMIEVEKNQARKDFERTVSKEVVNILIASPGGQRIIGEVRETIGGAVEAAEAVQTAVESGSPIGALQDALVKKVGDFPLAQAAARQVGSVVGHTIDRALGGALTKVENAIDNIQGGMGEAIDTLRGLDAKVAKVDESAKQPTSLFEENSVIGKIIPVDRANAVVDVAADAYAGAAKIAGALQPGDTRGKMRDRVRGSLLDERVRGIHQTLAGHGVGQVYCISVDRADYEAAAQALGEAPEIPTAPERAVYKVCYINGTREAVFARMYGGEPEPTVPAAEEAAPPPAEDGGEIPVGTWTGETRYPDNTKARNPDSEVIVVINSVTLQVEEDGTVYGDLISECFYPMSAFQVHSDIKGVISGQLLGEKGQLNVDYAFRSHITGEPCTPETPCQDDTAEAVFPYHVTVADGIMSFQVAADIEDYYDFELRRE